MSDLKIIQGSIVTEDEMKEYGYDDVKLKGHQLTRENVYGTETFRLYDKDDGLVHEWGGLRPEGPSVDHAISSAGDRAALIQDPEEPRDPNIPMAGHPTRHRWM